jgi:hypothetical protein
MDVGHIYTLPASGRPARLRPVNLLKLVELGKIPSTLEALVAEMLWGESPEKAETTEREEAEKWLELAGIICVASFTDPVIVETPTADNEISLDHVEIADRLWVGELMIGPTLALSMFRQEPSANVGITPDGDGDKSTAVKSGGRE